MLLATKVIVCDIYLAPVLLLLTFLNIQLKPRGWQTYIILSIVIFYSLLVGAGVETAVCSFFRTSATVIVVRNWKAVVRVRVPGNRPRSARFFAEHFSEVRNRPPR